MKQQKQLLIRPGRAEAWHTNEYLNGGPLIKDLNRRIPEDEKGDDTKAFDHCTCCVSEGAS